jgi:hypothetical protein
MHVGGGSAALGIGTGIHPNRDAALAGIAAQLRTVYDPRGMDA